MIQISNNAAYVKTQNAKNGVHGTFYKKCMSFIDLLYLYQFDSAIITFKKNFENFPENV